MQTWYFSGVKDLRFLAILVLLFSLGLLFSACESVPEEIPEDLSKAQMFQRAQEEMDRGNFESAQRYYEEFIRRNPDDQGSITEAEYEIAFIAYKQEDYEAAKELFTDLLDKYDVDSTATLPEWPRILSQRLLLVVEERLEEENAPLIRTNLDQKEPETAEE